MPLNFDPAHRFSVYLGTSDPLLRIKILIEYNETIPSFRKLADTRKRVKIHRE